MRKRKPSPRLRLRLERPAPGEVDHELLWGALLLVLFAAAWALPFWRQSLPFYFCPFKQLTGLPCVLCGGTRTLCALTRGRWGVAFGLNPLAALAGLLGALYALYAAGAVATGRRLRLSPAGASGRARLIFLLAAAAAVAANWAYLIAHGAVGDY